MQDTFSPTLGARLRDGRTRARRGKVILAEAELEELRTKITQAWGDNAAILRGIRSKLQAHAASGPAEPAMPKPFHSIAGDFRDRIQALADSGQIASMDDLRSAIEGMRVADNSRPDPAMGGLSPDQVHHLIHMPWNSPDCPMQINHDLDPADLADNRLLRNVRTFLEALRSAEGPTATATGNLSRRFVAEMMERMDWEEGFLDKVHKYNKVINEPDVQPLHAIRIMSLSAGLIRAQKTSWRVTGLGRELLSPERAGELFAALFTAMFTRINLAYFDQYPEFRGVQICVAYTLYRICVLAKDWAPVEGLGRQVLLPAAYEEIERLRSPYIKPEGPLRTRIIIPLADFGLLECRYEKQEYMQVLSAIRMTDLFGRLVRFQW